MLQKVHLHNVKRGSRVTLTKELPVDHEFGNKNPVRQNLTGDVMSEGFVAGVLLVRFYTHVYGTENVKFNERSADNYLLIDIY